MTSLGWIDKLSGNVSQLEKVFKNMDSCYQEPINEHLSPNRPLSMEGDMLDLLIRLREDRSYTVGVDTSVAAITWAMTALIKKPNVLKKVQEEIRSSIRKKGRVDEDDIDKLPYLKAIVKETLRLYPPNPLTVPRLTTKTCTIDGYEIEPDMIVFKGQDFWVLTFGSGRRQCPGLSEDDVDTDSMPGITTHKKNALCWMPKTYLI